MKKFLTAIGLLLPLFPFAQSTPKNLFDPGLYDLVYFGPAAQTVVIDPELNAALSPLPYDRFFYLKVYAKVDDPPVLAAGVSERAGKIFKEVRFVYVDKIPTPATSPDYKAGYVMYQITMVPLNPQHRYVIASFSSLSDDNIDLLVDVIMQLRDDYKNNVKDLAGFNTKLEAYNKKTESGLVPVLPRDLRVYYEEKIKNMTIAGPRGQLGDDQLKAIIKNLLQKDIFITAKFKKGIWKKNMPIGTGDTTAIVKTPIFMTAHEYATSGFKAFSVDTRVSAVVTVDAGMIAYGLQNSLLGGTTYIGLDFYLRPFDPNIPFRFVNKYNPLSLANRLSVTAGVSLNSVAKPNYRADLFGTKNNLIAGLGFRFNNLIKFNAGGLAYYKLDPNFLTGGKKINMTPYVGASIDIRVGTIFSSFSKLFSL